MLIEELEKLKIFFYWVKENLKDKSFLEIKKKYAKPRKTEIIYADEAPEEPVEEVIAEALQKLKKRYPKTIVNAQIPQEFILLPMDAILIEQVTINLLENAIVHSGSQKPVQLIVENYPNLKSSLFFLVGIYKISNFLKKILSI